MVGGTGWKIFANGLVVVNGRMTNDRGGRMGPKWKGGIAFFFPFREFHSEGEGDLADEPTIGGKKRLLLGLVPLEDPLVWP